MPSIDKYTQTPSERKKYVFDYAKRNALDDGETITQLAYATAVDSAPNCTTPAAITAGSGQVEDGGQIAFFFVSGGTDGVSYIVSLIVTTSAGQTLENTISVQVKSP